ncbi:MAG: zinc ABC transporter substrate-binding protein [Sulfuricurvum sp.]|uniref:metal ABC transporter solute-binding protein, Zn/Mn family n=1 Tax=Sulfuricurvum sp. TaxID=2025608 RepID=UPI002607FE93|nr:zinc ABC transporter substrate-binding protein [Sulfuricurvum sp.]MDD2368280.1 zinc ABC transporter substrate-binding protein [Sulfuricurvum sp.]MDD2949254.1 zinc ABC transporter substrate-binding protein [Sulfuricurvum sp.]MDD5117191.1 zinc ABC transporter substrate-binding protein [Sulfuricurvum sp.]
MDTKRLIVFGGIIAAIVIGMSFFSPKLQMKQESIKLPVVSVSTFSLYEVAHAVAGESLEIHPIIPLGTDAHMFSPNPKQVAGITESALFIYNGAGFETWAENLKQTLPKTTQVIDMSQHVALIKSEGHGDHDQGEEHHHEGMYDPHYWLDIDNMIKMTQMLDREFSKLSPVNAELYHGNAAAYIGKLQKLKSEYAAGLAECKNRTLITNHDAFGYLAKANHLENVSVIGLSSDEQPSAKNIADIISLVKEHGVKTIFFEEFINDNVSQTIARETGAKAQSLQPLENISEDELKSHQTYLTIMDENLKKLREAMECR